MTYILVFPHSYVDELGDKAAIKIIYLCIGSFL